MVPAPDQTDATPYSGGGGRGRSGTGLGPRAGFQSDFVWGAASAAYQIEGGAEEDGRGWSIWDAFTKVQRRVSGGATGDVACDHYRLFERDVALLRSLGVRHYQFSVSWPRVQPTGQGPPCESGLGFYVRLVECLVRHGIEPVVVLYHWDLPLALQLDIGGWASSEIIPLFADYAREVFCALGRCGVKRWITLNEPWNTALLSVGGVHAPGTQSKDPSDPYVVGHHLLLAHAAAVRVFREELRLHEEGGEIGITLSVDWAEPAPVRATSESGGAAAVRAQLNAEAAGVILDCSIGWFAGPILEGDYPAAMRARCGDQLPAFAPEERAFVHGSADFLGLRHRRAELVEVAVGGVDGASAGEPLHQSDVRLFKDPAWPLSASGDEMTPWALRKALLWVQSRYRPKGGLFVIGPGFSSRDQSRELELDDRERMRYMHSYLSEMRGAMAEGADVRGFFAWSLLDGFEFQNGYDLRYGLVHVDFQSQRRTPKASARWFSRVARQNALVDCEDFTDSHGGAPLEAGGSCGSGAIWWVSQHAGDGRQGTSASGAEQPLVPCDAAVDSVSEALRALLRDKAIGNNAQIMALASLDAQSVLCALQAVELHLQTRSQQDEAAAAATHSVDHGAGAPCPQFAAPEELCRAAERVAEEVDAAALCHRGADQPGEARLAAGGQPSDRQAAVAVLACLQWDNAMDEAQNWKAERLQILRDAGLGTSAQCTELAAVGQAALAAALLLARQQDAAPWQGHGLSAKLSSPAAAVQLHQEASGDGGGRLWWMAADGDALVAGADGDAEVLLEPSTAALLDLLRGTGTEPEAQSLALKDLDPDTMRAVLEAVEQHTAGAPRLAPAPAGDKSPGAPRAGPSIVSAKLLEVALQVTAEVERVQGPAAVAGLDDPP